MARDEVTSGAAWALSPRLPEEVGSMEDQRVCPLCGSPDFDDGYCAVCGYSDDDEAGPIELEDGPDVEVVDDGTTTGPATDDVEPGEEDLVDGGPELVYDDGVVMVFADGDAYSWACDGTDLSGVAYSVEEAVAEAEEALDVEGEYDLVESCRYATRHFSQSEIRELEDEIDGTELANASRLRY